MDKQNLNTFLMKEMDADMLLFESYVAFYRQYHFFYTLFLLLVSPIRHLN